MNSPDENFLRKRLTFSRKTWCPTFRTGWSRSTLIWWYQKTDLVEVYQILVEGILKKIEDFIDVGSGLTLTKTKRLEVNVKRHVSFGTGAPALPFWLKSSTDLINVDNHGMDYYFARAATSAFCLIPLK